MESCLLGLSLFAFWDGWNVQVPAPVALTAVCLLAYLFCRRSPLIVSSDSEATRREARRAAHVARELEKIAEALRADLASHRGRVDRFKERVANIQASPSEATLQDLCREAEEILRPTMRLSNQISCAYDELRQQTNHLMAFSEARTDPLTGAHNRRALNESLDSMFSMKARYGYCFSLLLVDVDHFKQVNDMHGHLVGDQILKDVVSVIGELSRDTDVVTRYGGEEFVVLLPGTPLQGALLFAERVRSKIAERLSVTVSGGVAAAESCQNGKQLLSRADAALYAAKETGRNRICFYDGDMVQASQVPEIVPPTVAAVGDEPKALTAAPGGSGKNGSPPAASPTA
ncbi:MAG: GGDEF domain-containing protein [Planctomycetota bacterium]|mgnify:CR=1 FL=1|nr:MAG: GGDEF domain-containing protein [Planctomycetota bacterium]REJ93962.1 MAG: GGDEF domain-containing protein [Planctomycetota bacterium]REK30942.1 MAG: GGDEF domain-containing protein [Planctomycetota bacterium]REK38194.1 MAG: GGDEF domain-containing protein [Planctomycetota bacterium]